VLSTLLALIPATKQLHPLKQNKTKQNSYKTAPPTQTKQNKTAPPELHFQQQLPHVCSTIAGYKKTYKTKFE
jgi:hypothetical protein